MLEASLATLLEQPIPWFCCALAIFSTFFLGFARSSLGAGGFVVSPLMALAIGGSDALAVLAALMLVASIVSSWQHRKEAVHSVLNPLLIAAVVGTALGGMLLWWLVSSGKEASVHRDLEYIVGGLTLFYTVLIALRKRIASGGPNRLPHWAETFSIGTMVGASQTVANSGTPMLTVFFVRFHLHKDSFVAAQAFFLTAQNILKLIPLVLLGILHFGNFNTAILLLPFLLLGGWVGGITYRKWSEGALFKLYIAALAVGCLASLIIILGRANFYGLF